MYKRQVYSSIPTVEGKGDYASMSGTSMASRYVAGASVLVKSYMAENWTGSYDAASMTENLMMSTASPVVDPETKRGECASSLGYIAGNTGDRA